VKYLLIDYAGKLEVREWSSAPTLEEMQKIVLGWLEMVRLAEYEGGGGVALWLNEEGKLIPLAPNVFLSTLNDYLRGPIFITGLDAEGAVRGLTDDEIVHTRIVKRIGGKPHLIFNYADAPDAKWAV
jgi:hypothetical protein